MMVANVIAGAFHDEERNSVDNRHNYDDWANVFCVKVAIMWR